MKYFKYTRKELVNLFKNSEEISPSELCLQLLATISPEEQSQKIMMEQVDKPNPQVFDEKENNKRVERVIKESKPIKEPQFEEIEELDFKVDGTPDIEIRITINQLILNQKEIINYLNYLK